MEPPIKNISGANNYGAWHPLTSKDSVFPQGANKGEKKR